MNKNFTQENAALLKEFKGYLEDQGTLEKKVEQHTKNMDLFLNTFLSKRQGVGCGEWVRHIDVYFSEWFIRNAPTPSETQIVLSIASMRKFYGMMLEKGAVSQADVNRMESMVVNKKEDWKDAMDIHNEELAGGSAEVVPEEEEDSASATPKWESKTAKYGSDVDGADEDVDLSSGFIVEGGKDEEEEEEDDKKKDEDLLFGELDLDEEFEGTEFDEDEFRKDDEEDDKDDDKDDDDKDDDDKDDDDKDNDDKDDDDEGIV